MSQEKEIKEKRIELTGKPTKEIRLVPIQEYFKKIDKKVFWIWRFGGNGKWQKWETPLKEIPYVKFKLKCQIYRERNLNNLKCQRK